MLPFAANSISAADANGMNTFDETGGSIAKLVWPTPKRHINMAKS